jgi:hypothetical protein
LLYCPKLISVGAEITSSLNFFSILDLTSTGAVDDEALLMLAGPDKDSAGFSNCRLELSFIDLIFFSNQAKLVNHWLQNCYVVLLRKEWHRHLSGFAPDCPPDASEVPARLLEALQRDSIVAFRSMLGFGTLVAR